MPHVQIELGRVCGRINKELIQMTFSPYPNFPILDFSEFLEFQNKKAAFFCKSDGFEPYLRVVIIFMVSLCDSVQNPS